MSILGRLGPAALLRLLPRNVTVPAVVLAVGWYGGAKYGAPDVLMSTVDGAIAQGGDLVNQLMNQVGGGGDAG